MTLAYYYILTRPQFEHQKGFNPTRKRGDGSKGKGIDNCIYFMVYFNDNY